jgi:tetratricopeptide (TPR) repeat protein
VLTSLGKRDDALAASKAALAAAEALLAREPQSDEVRRLVASANFTVAVALRSDELEAPHWKASETLFEQLLAERPDDPDRMRNVALVNKYLGGRLQTRSEEIEAERRYRRALELDERRMQANPDDRMAQFDVAIDLANLGSSLANADRAEEALQHYERSIAMRAGLVEADPNDVLARTTLSRVLSATARVRFLAGDVEGAQRDAARSLAAVDATARASADVGPRENAARALLVLARVDLERSRAAAACAHCRQAMQFAGRDQLTADGSGGRVWIEGVEARPSGCAAVRPTGRAGAR